MSPTAVKIKGTRDSVFSISKTGDAMNRLTSTFAIMLSAFLLCGSCFAQRGGLIGGVGSSDKGKNKQPVEKDPFDDGAAPTKEKPPASKPPQPPPKATKSPTLEQQIEGLGSKIDRLEKKRDSSQIIDNITSLEEAQKVADRYGELANKIPRTDRRAELLDRLKRELARAQRLINAAIGKKLTPGGVAEGVELNRINRSLLSVYLLRERLRLLDLLWQQEMQRPKIALKLQTKSVKLQFISWENQPELDKLPKVGGAIVPSMKDVTILIGHKFKSSGALLATMDLNLKVDLWDFGQRNYDLTLMPLASPAPTIPAGMRKRPELRYEAGNLESQCTLFRIPVTVEMLSELRQTGQCQIELSQIRPVRELRHWVLLDAKNATLRLVVQSRPNRSGAGDQPKSESGKDPSDKQPGESGDGKSDKGNPSESGGGKPDDSSSSKTPAPPEKPKDSGADEPSSEDMPDDAAEDKENSGGEKDDDAEDGMKISSETSADSGAGADSSQSDREKTDEEILSPSIFPREPPRQNASGRIARPGAGAGRASPRGASGTVRGNWLSLAGVRKIPAPYVSGLWNNTRANQLEWFDVTEDQLIIRPADDLASRSVNVTRKNNDRFFGEAYTVPRSGKCTRYGFWQPAALSITGGQAAGQWKGRRTDQETCMLGDEPDEGPLGYERLQLAAFVPLASGQLLHVVASPSVGNQQAQLKATAKIALDTSGTPVVRARIESEGQLLNSEDQGTTFDFVTTRSGRHTLLVEMLSADGRILHREDIQIDVPPISGIGK